MIQVDNIGKRYPLASRRGRSASLRTAMRDFILSPLRRYRRLAGHHSASEQFWALRHLSFSVAPGEVVGIVGRNGAGKSTLLKILSRITDPTEGRAVLDGRVSSLLEVGTGFHPELSGRENIYLNGAVLGLSRAEIRQRFDAIVDFAEVEAFLDTPVKHYSSGMYVRLAFAVAAHLEPEILIVDEVLAVGDADFQRKCLGKMKSVGNDGRTVLFVSHNLPAVEALCTRAILLENGQLAGDASADEIVRQYLRRSAEAPAERIDRQDVLGDAPYVTNFAMYDSDGELAHAIPFQSNSQLRFDFHSPRSMRELHFVLRLYDEDGRLKASVSSRESPCPSMRDPGRYSIAVDLPTFACLPGRYRWDLDFYRPRERKPFAGSTNLWQFQVLPRVLPGASHTYGPEHGQFSLTANLSVDHDRELNNSPSGCCNAASELAVGELRSAVKRSSAE